MIEKKDGIIWEIKDFLLVLYLSLEQNYYTII